MVADTTSRSRNYVCERYDFFSEDKGQTLGYDVTVLEHGLPFTTNCTGSKHGQLDYTEYNNVFRVSKGIMHMSINIGMNRMHEQKLLFFTRSFLRMNPVFLNLFLLHSLHRQDVHLGYRL